MYTESYNSCIECYDSCIAEGSQHLSLACSDRHLNVQYQTN